MASVQRRFHAECKNQNDGVVRTAFFKYPVPIFIHEDHDNDFTKNRKSMPAVNAHLPNSTNSKPASMKPY